MIAKLTQYTVLKDFGDYAEERNWTIVLNVSFVSFFYKLVLCWPASIHQVESHCWENITMVLFDGQFLSGVWEVCREGLWLCCYQGLKEQLNHH